jgi:hypothetical protein
MQVSAGLNEGAGCAPTMAVCHSEIAAPPGAARKRSSRCAERMCSSSPCRRTTALLSSDTQPDRLSPDHARTAAVLPALTLHCRSRHSPIQSLRFSSGPERFAHFMAQPPMHGALLILEAFAGVSTLAARTRSPGGLLSFSSMREGADGTRRMSVELELGARELSERSTAQTEGGDCEEERKTSPDKPVPLSCWRVPVDYCAAAFSLFYGAWRSSRARPSPFASRSAR